MKGAQSAVVDNLSSRYFLSTRPPHTSIVLELDEGPLFVSTGGHRAATLREGMVLNVHNGPTARIHSVNIICPCSGPWPRSSA